VLLVRMFFHKVKSATTLTIFVSYLVCTVYPCCWPVHFIFTYFSIKIPQNYFNVISWNFVVYSLQSFRRTGLLYLPVVCNL
jgi:hypothetical protein